jgi:hypothetical protein
LFNSHVNLSIFSSLSILLTGKCTACSLLVLFPF